MNYIKPDQFLKLPEEVQKVFIDWWKPDILDLFFTNLGEIGIVESCIEGEHALGQVIELKGKSRFPLLTLEQLWEFIEDITGDKVYVVNYPGGLRGVGLVKEGCEFGRKTILESFWALAVDVASGNWRDD